MQIINDQERELVRLLCVAAGVEHHRVQGISCHWQIHGQVTFCVELLPSDEHVEAALSRAKP